MPVCLVGEGGAYEIEDGAMQLTCDEGTRELTLSVGEASFTGKANAKLTRIRWSSGAVWTREEPRDRDLVFEQPDLLSERQVGCVVDRVNGAIDIWLLSEDHERALIEPPVQQANAVLKDSLRAVMTEDWSKAVEVLLDETKSPDAKTQEMQDIIGRCLREPLIEQLNGRIDVPMFSEAMEEKLFRLIVEKLLDEIVDLCVLGMEKTGFV